MSISIAGGNHEGQSSYKFDVPCFSANTARQGSTFVICESVLKSRRKSQYLREVLLVDPQILRAIETPNSENRLGLTGVSADGRRQTFGTLQNAIWHFKTT